jgi:hypothetical protein
MSAVAGSHGLTGPHDVREVRRRHLAALAYELEARGLNWRLLGPDESVLRVTRSTTGRRLMVVAMPSGDGWSFLWSKNGAADVADPALVADRIARLLDGGADATS